MTKRIELDINSGVAEVKLNRPEKHNALDHAMFESLIDVGEKLAKDRSIRAVILYGAGKSFCAGIDLSIFSGESSSDDFLNKMEPRDDSLANYYQSAAYVWREIPVPVIAALHGAVYGGGLQIALGADIRYADKNSAISIMEIKWGIIPDMALTTSIPNLINIDKAFEITMTGDILDAKTAFKLGLITGVKSDPLSQARELANIICQKSPDAIRSIKKLFYDTWGSNDKISLSMEADIQKKVMSSPNHMEAVKSSINRSEPDFSDSEL